MAKRTRLDASPGGRKQNKACKTHLEYPGGNRDRSANAGYQVAHRYCPAAVPIEPRLHAPGE